MLVMESDGFDEAAGADDGTFGKIADSMEQLADQSRIPEWFLRSASRGFGLARGVVAGRSR
jgi:hypothetical protein